MSENPRLSKNRHPFLVLVLAGMLCYLTTGLFVIQPIGALPEGVTVWYWRVGTKLPFIASADGMLAGEQDGISLLGRGIALAALAKPITERKIMSLPYSRTLYLVSTGGREFSQ